MVLPDRKERHDGIKRVNMLQKEDSGFYDLILMDVQMPNMDGHLAKPIEVSKLMKTLALVLK